MYFALSTHACTAQLRKAATKPLISFNRFNSRYNGYTTQPKWSTLCTLLLRTYLTKTVLPQVRKMNLKHFQRQIYSAKWGHSPCPLYYNHSQAAAFRPCYINLNIEEKPRLQPHKTTLHILNHIFHTFVRSFCSVLRQIHSLFQSKLSEQRDLALPLKISSILSFPQDSPVAAYVFFLVFPSLLSYLPLNNVLYKAVPAQDVTNPVSLPSCLLFVRYSSPHWLFIILHFSHERSNWSPSSSMYHISKLSRYFWPTFRSVQVSAPFKPVLRM